MRRIDTIRLICLAALWGSSFAFTKSLVPVLGYILTPALRVSIAGVALLCYYKLIGFDVQWKRWWRQYLIIGVGNAAIPFALYAFALLFIPTTYAAIFNTTSPLFGAVLATLFLQERLTPKKLLGLLLGAAGVALTVHKGSFPVTPSTLLALGACLAASLCYALSGVYIKKYAKDVNPLGIAGASQLLAGIALIPLLPAFPPLSALPATEAPLFILRLLGFSMLCSAAAFILYYQLIKNVGPTKTLTTSFLMPLFSLLWGVLFFKESLGLFTLLGCAIVLLGTGLVLDFVKLPKNLFRSSRS